MRYVSHIDNLVLYSSMLPPNSLDPATAPTGYRPLYRFYNGVLIVGDPTTGTGAGNSIAFGDSSTPPELRVQRIFPTDLSGRTEDDSGVVIGELCGLNRLFWEAPLITVNPGTPFTPPAATAEFRHDPNAPPITYRVRYQVISGTVRVGSREYRAVEDGRQNIFYVETAGDPPSIVNVEAVGGPAVIALYYPEPVEKDKFDQMRDIMFRWKHLLVGDEAAWDITQPGSYRGRDFGWIRE